MGLLLGDITSHDLGDIYDRVVRATRYGLMAEWAGRNYGIGGSLLKFARHTACYAQLLLVANDRICQ